MTCARRVVKATLIAADGRRFIGWNYCENPQPVCPRLPGEGYGPCVTVCRQPAHAEVVALDLAGDAARGATVYVEGHTYACGACLDTARRVGASVVLGAPPAA